jgi:uncharacterized protein YndB with AHSA1/START domain
MTTNKITIEATILADIKKVWEYYTKPEHIVKWNFASDDWQCPSATNDLKVGGKYWARMEAKDGSFGFDFEATYSKIIEFEKIEYVLFDTRVVEIQFKQLADKTEVIVRFDAETENPIDMQRDGWQAILNNFKKHVESN